MTRLKDDILGYYVPSFFEMHVDTYRDDLTIDQLPLEDMTVLFHEYIHFLQDFTTYYGLNAIYAYSEYLHSVVNRIYGIKTPDFHVPFIISDNADNVLLNKKIVELTQGDSTSRDSYDVEEIDEDSDVLPQNIYMEEIPNVILNLNGDMCAFGAMAIMENMAYLMERLCSPSGYVTSPEFPYMAAEKVADYYVKGFSGDPLMVLALCDMSLQSSNPGACFVRVMKGIRDGNIFFGNPEEIYDYFYKQVAVTSYGTETALIANLKMLLGVVQNCMKSYLRDMPILTDYYRWIDNLVSFAIDWRESDRYFLLKMARHNDLSTNGAWGYALHRVGTPLMTNNNGNHYKVLQNGANGGMDVEYFKAIRQIQELFEYGKTKCAMYSWCVNSPNATPNGQCSTAPWEKSAEAKICPYAFLWKHWNLKGRIPNIK